MTTEFNWTQPRIVVKRSLLSRKPAENSGLVAAASAMVILFVSVLVWRDSPELFRLLAAVPERVMDQQEYWRLFSALAVHSNWMHLFSNLPFVVFFSYLLYGYFGFGVYPLGVIVLSVVTNYLSLLTYSPEVHLVGASGMTHVMAGFWLAVYILVERSLPLKKRVMRSLGVALILSPALCRSTPGQLSNPRHRTGSGGHRGRNLFPAAQALDPGGGSPGDRRR